MQPQEEDDLVAFSRTFQTTTFSTKLQVSLGLKTLAVWSDSQSFTTDISSKGKIVEAQGVLFDIEFLCIFFSSISFHHVPRLNNAEEDALAKLALLNLPKYI